MSHRLTGYIQNLGSLEQQELIVILFYTASLSLELEVFLLNPHEPFFFISISIPADLRTDCDGLSRGKLRKD
jgi:hypothetical protein